MKGITIGIITLGLLGSAFAHSWYPESCCSGEDCYPVPCDELLDSKDGGVYHTETQKTFEKSQTHPSQDNKCHVCIGNAGTPYCAFILPSA